MELAFPAQGAIGVTGNVFVGLPTKVVEGDSTGALVTGYEVTSEHSPFASFVAPELVPGAEQLSIDFGAGPQSIIAGQIFDFGPSGVPSFTLSGFDPLFASSELDKFVFGLKFAEEGLASLRAVPTLFIPAGDYNLNGLVDAADYVIIRKHESTEQYDIWRSHFGDPTSFESLTAVTIPEPSTHLLLAIAVTSLLGYRKAFQ